MVAMCTARAPISNDFGWGLKLNLSSGIRARHLRVVAASWSNSGSSVSLILMKSSIGRFAFYSPSDCSPRSIPRSREILVTRPGRALDCMEQLQSWRAYGSHREPHDRSPIVSDIRGMPGRGRPGADSGPSPRLKLLDEEWARHSENVGSPLGRNHLVVWNERNGLAVRHEPDRRPEELENGAGDFDPFPGRS